MTTDLDTLPTALYVRIDDQILPRHQGRRQGRPPRLGDAELLTIAVAEALLGVHYKACRLQFLPTHLQGAFPYLPGQSSHNKRFKHVLLPLKGCTRTLAADTDI